MSRMDEWPGQSKAERIERLRKHAFRGGMRRKPEFKRNFEDKREARRAGLLGAASWTGWQCTFRKRRDIARRAGIASGESKRRKKALAGGEPLAAYIERSVKLPATSPLDEAFTAKFIRDMQAADAMIAGLSSPPFQKSERTL